jgi:hypothetical protein
MTLSGTNGAPSPSDRTQPHDVLNRRLILRLLLWRLPALAMLLLALGGVAFTNLAPQSTALYWQLLTPVFGAICVASDWSRVRGEPRWRLVRTQTLHWGAVLLAMHMLFFADVQNMFNSDAVGLMILGILALGTVLAGVHAGDWETAAVGVILAVSVPAVAKLEQMTLLLLLLFLLAIAALGLVFWLRARLNADARAPGTTTAPPS